jgi:HK97 family phage major capsid protein
MKRLKELRDRAARVAAQMRALHEKAEKEDRGFSADEDQQWNALNTDFEKLERDIQDEERRSSRLGSLDEVIRRNGIDGAAGGGAPESGGQPETRGLIRFCGQELRSIYASPDARQAEDPDLAIAFDAFIRGGERRLSPEHRQLIERRAQSIGTANLGGFTVPTDFAAGIEIALKAFSGIRQAATVISTGDGRALPWPTVNDTAISGAIIAENTADSDQDVTFGQLSFGAYTYTSRLVKVSVELLQDTAIDLGALLARLLGERLGRATSAHYATGTGTGQPQGIVTASTLGKAAASATAFTYDEMLDLKHAVDVAYRLNARWALSDAVLKAVKKLKDLEGRPIWQPNIAQAVPATIEGDAYVIDNGLPTALTTGQKIMLYGDLSKYTIRDVLGYQLVIMRELYAANRQIGFNMFMRTDGKLVDAGTNPVKHLALA